MLALRLIRHNVIRVCRPAMARKQAPPHRSFSMQRHRSTLALLPLPCRFLSDRMASRPGLFDYQRRGFSKKADDDEKNGDIADSQQIERV